MARRTWTEDERLEIELDARRAVDAIAERAVNDLGDDNGATKEKGALALCELLDKKPSYRSEISKRLNRWVSDGGQESRVPADWFAVMARAHAGAAHRIVAGFVDLARDALAERPADLIRLIRVLVELARPALAALPDDATGLVLQVCEATGRGIPPVKTALTEEQRMEGIYTAWRRLPKNQRKAMAEDAAEEMNRKVEDFEP